MRRKEVDGSQDQLELCWNLPGPALKSIFFFLIYFNFRGTFLSADAGELNAKPALYFQSNRFVQPLRGSSYRK